MPDDEKKPVVQKPGEWVYSPESYKLPPIDNVMPMPKVKPLKPEPKKK